MSTYDDYMGFLNDYTGKDIAQAYIDARILKANEKITEANDRLIAADLGIQNTLSGLDSTSPDIPNFDDIAPPNSSSDSLKSQAVPTSDITKPDSISIPDLDIDDFDLDDIGDVPDSPDLNDVDFAPLNSLDIPDADTVIGSPPSDVFTFTPEAYVSSFIEFLQEQIQSAMVALDDDSGISVESHVDLRGNTNDIVLVDNDIEDAIYDRALARVTEEESREETQVTQAFQARGFSLPPGALNAALANVRSNTVKLLADANRDVIASRITLEQKRTEYELQKAAQITDAQYKYDTIVTSLEEANIKYKTTLAQMVGTYTDAGVAIEKILSDIHINEEAQRFESEKESFNSAINIYNLKIELYKSLMQGYMTEAQVAVETIKAETEYNKELIAIYAQDVQAWMGLVESKKVEAEGKRVNADIGMMEVQAAIEEVKAENERYMISANVFESEVKAYAAIMSGLEVAETLDLKRYDSESRGKAAEITALTQKAVAEIDQAVKMAGLSIEALKSQTQISGSIISASLNAMNTSASFDFSGSARQAHTSSYGKALHVGYSYSGMAEDVSSPKTDI